MAIVQIRYLLALLMCVTLGTAGTEGNAIITENLEIVNENNGIMLKQQGFVALESTEQLLSIFRKVKLPQINQQATPNCKSTEIEESHNMETAEPNRSTKQETEVVIIH